MEDKKNLNYGGATWHVFINLLLGLLLLVVAVYGGLTFHPIIYMLSLPTPLLYLKSYQMESRKILGGKIKD